MIHQKAGTGNYQNEKMANADTRPVPALIMYSAKIRATWPGKVAVLPEWMCGCRHLAVNELWG